MSRHVGVSHLLMISCPTGRDHFGRATPFSATFMMIMSAHAQ